MPICCVLDDYPTLPPHTDLSVQMETERTCCLPGGGLHTVGDCNSLKPEPLHLFFTSSDLYRPYSLSAPHPHNCVVSSSPRIVLFLKHYIQIAHFLLQSCSPPAPWPFCKLIRLISVTQHVSQSFASAQSVMADVSELSMAQRAHCGTYAISSPPLVQIDLEIYAFLTVLSVRSPSLCLADRCSQFSH